MIHPEGRIIDQKYKWMYENEFSEIVSRATVGNPPRVLLERNQELLLRFIHDARIGKTLRGRAKKKVGRARLVKYVQDLKKLDEYFSKDLDAITTYDMERFISDLDDGVIKSQVGRSFAKETQVAIKHIIKKFYKWLLNDVKKLDELTGWFDTSYEVKDKPYLQMNDVELMAQRMVSNNEEQWVRNRALVMVLADIGARADELLNVRLKHVLQEGEGVKLRLEFSKTKKRTIALSFSEPYVREWLAIHPLAEVVDEKGQLGMGQLFPMSYHAIKGVLARSGKRIGKHVTPHTMRRTSATYWAAHLTPYLLCSRFGWSMNSRQPARYIQQAGIDQKEFLRAAGRAEKVQTDETVATVAAENQNLKNELSALKQQIEELMRNDMNELRGIINHVKNTGWVP